MAVELRLGEVLRLKKRHPCGSEEWEVYRVGADVGIKCVGCGRRVLLPRSRLEPRIRVVRSRTAPRLVKGEGAMQEVPRPHV